MIGLFDSGVGGLAVWEKLKDMMPGASTLYLADSAFAPYGEKSAADIVERSKRVVRTLIEHGARMVVVACNTATVNAIDALREEFPDTPIVGIEPAIKPAATASDAIIVLGTKSTVSNPRYHALVDEYAAGKQVWNIGAPELVHQVERGDLADTTNLSSILTQPVFEGASALVIGCTHFSFLTPTIQKSWPHLQIFDGADGVVRRAETIANDLGIDDDEQPTDAFVTTGEPRTVQFVNPPISLRHIELSENQE
jgi:glutamate racemase